MYSYMSNLTTKITISAGCGGQTKASTSPSGSKAQKMSTILQESRWFRFYESAKLTLGPICNILTMKW